MRSSNRGLRIWHDGSLYRWYSGPQAKITGDPAKTVSGRLDEVKKWLTSQGITGDQHKEILNFLKTALFDGLTPTGVDNSYYDFLKGLVPLV